MSDYTRIRPAISHYEDLARAASGEKFVSHATAHFSDLHQKYYSKVENPDYSADIKKFCYLYKYSVAHGYYIFRALQKLADEITPPPLSRNPTRIACIGGGPGTEILGIARYLREIEKKSKGTKLRLQSLIKKSRGKRHVSVCLNV